MDYFIQLITLNHKKGDGIIPLPFLSEIVNVISS